MQVKIEKICASLRCSPIDPTFERVYRFERNFYKISRRVNIVWNVISEMYKSKLGCGPIT